MNKPRQVLKYVLADYLSASLAWGLFYFFRKTQIEADFYGVSTVQFPDKNFYLGVTVLPLVWVVIYTLMGSYTDIYRKSRLRELAQTFSVSILGVLSIFFVLLLDDVIITYRSDLE
jgi:hypothetical protein